MRLLSSIILLGILLPASYSSQALQDAEYKNFSIGTYGRIGANWSFDVQGLVARQLNLNGMGMLGGRMEENDYLEFFPAVHFEPKIFGKKKTKINMQIRLAAFTSYGQLIGNVNTASPGGLVLQLNEMYLEAKEINGSPWTVWIGARLYRGGDVYLADHWYFDDLSSQGFGIRYNNTEFVTLFVSAVDTNSTLPPYFYVNTATGTPSLELRQRIVGALMHTFYIGKNHRLKLLAEYHRLGDASGQEEPAPEPYDSTDVKLNYPSDWGGVLGVKHMWDLSMFSPGSFNDLSIRYGTRIANGGDGGMSRTWLTYGAPNFETERFDKAYSLAIIEHFMLNFSDKFSLNGYMAFTDSRGAAESDSTADTYFGREVFNKKTDFALGFRPAYYVSDIFHLMGEVQYSSRIDGAQDEASVLKLSIIPTLVPTGERSQWARPHLRFIYTIAFYNDFARDNLYSPYLQVVGPQSVGHYFGIRAEWWIW